jgi:CRISPR-associated endonuclease/helicase Cas3
MTPHNGIAPLLKPAFTNGLGAWKENNVYVGIYADLSVLELTRRLVIDYPCWTIPEMNRLLVESATHPERIIALNKELGKPWADYWQQIYGKEIADVGAGRMVALPIGEHFGTFKFPSGEEEIRTRLGAEGAKVTFSEPAEGPFWQPVSGITLPSHWSHGVDTREPVTAFPSSGGLRFQVGELSLLYDRRGLTRTGE